MNVLLITIQRDLDVNGIKSLHHVLLARGHASRLLFVPRYNPGNSSLMEALARFVEGYGPGLIGISLMAIEAERAQSLTSFLKQRFPRTPVVWGGIHPSSRPDLCARHTDYVCVGEGENTIVAMADAIATAQPLSEISNLAFYEGECFRQNPLSPLMRDLDSLPIVRMISPESYVCHAGRVEPVTEKTVRRYMRFGTRIYNIQTSRGCPYRCAYCNNSHLARLYPDWGVRRRSVEHVLAELEQAVGEYPNLEYINFQDDCFLACSREYLDTFCHEFKRRIGKRIIAKATPVLVTQERMEKLKDIGLAWFNMGLQSGSERVCREVYNRSSRPADFLRAAAVIHDLKIAAWYDIIVDNPFETPEDHYLTVETLMKTPKPFHPQMFSLTFFWQTDLHDRAAKECPDLIGDPGKRDLWVHRRTPINDLIEVSTVLNASLMRKLLEAYRARPEAADVRAWLFLAKWYSRLLLRPVSNLRTIRIAHNSSTWQTVRKLPTYFRVGFHDYLDLFREPPA